MKLSSELERYLTSVNIYRRSIEIEGKVLEYLDLELLEDMKRTSEHYKHIGE